MLDLKKTIWKSGTFIYPLPAVMVSCGDMEKSNIITVAWTGIMNTNPAMCYISVRPERYWRICNKSYNKRISICYRLVWSKNRSKSR